MKSTRSRANEVNFEFGEVIASSSAKREPAGTLTSEAAEEGVGEARQLLGELCMRNGPRHHPT